MTSSSDCVMWTVSPLVGHNPALLGCINSYWDSWENIFLATVCLKMPFLYLSTGMVAGNNFLSKFGRYSFILFKFPVFPVGRLVLKLLSCLLCSLPSRNLLASSYYLGHWNFMVCFGVGLGHFVIVNDLDPLGLLFWEHFFTHHLKNKNILCVYKYCLQNWH